MNQMIISRYTIPVNCRYKTKIAIISDLHNKCFKKVQANLISENPDIIFLTGDIFDRYTKNFLCFFQSEAIKCITFCGSYRPCFMCLGNHEYGFGDRGLKQIEKLGVKVLNDSYIKYRGLTIGGLTSGNTYKRDESLHITENKKEPNTEWLGIYEQEKDFKILLCHHPEYFEKYIRNKKINLTISGHAHGGQWRFFKQGIYSPGQGLFPKLTKGMYFNKRLLVSTGMANTAGMIPRLFNPKELVILELVPSKKTEPFH